MRERLRILRTVGKSLLEVVELDAVISHEINYTSAVTDHPVEDGSTISDHKRKEPTELSVTGFVTNTPVSTLGGGIIPGLDTTRARTAHDALVELHEGSELVQIEDALNVYTDMMLTALSIPRDRSSHQALRFTAHFRKITKVGLKTVEIAEAEQPGAAEKTDTGRQTPDDATPEQEDRSSTLLRAFKYVGIAE